MPPTLTTKLGLEKPDVNDNVDIGIINQNMDDIDAAFSGIVASYRNVIRNGDMGVKQRGAGPFTADGYCLDGYYAASVGGSKSVAPGVLAPGLVPGIKTCMNFTVAGQSAATDNMYFSIPIEGVETLAGQQVTLSFWCNASAGTPKVGVEVTQYFGAGGSPSATVNTTISAITVNTTSTRYSVTFTVPSISGKTLGTNGADNLNLNLWFSAGSNFASRASNIGIQNVSWTITGIQLEAGNVATAFERLPQQAQLAWCQRYYWRGTAAEVSALCIEGNAMIAEITFPVIMRAVPTQGNSALPHVFNIPFYGSSYTCTQAISPQYVTQRRGLWVYSQTAWGLTGGRIVVLGSASYLDATAEL